MITGLIRIELQLYNQFLVPCFLPMISSQGASNDNNYYNNNNITITAIINSLLYSASILPIILFLRHTHTLSLSLSLEHIPREETSI